MSSGAEPGIRRISLLNIAHVALLAAWIFSIPRPRSQQQPQHLPLFCVSVEGCTPPGNLCFSVRPGVEDNASTARTMNRPDRGVLYLPSATALPVTGCAFRIPPASVWRRRPHPDPVIPVMMLWRNLLYNGRHARQEARCPGRSGMDAAEDGMLLGCSPSLRDSCVAL
jgi:hypothetical protein